MANIDYASLFGNVVNQPQAISGLGGVADTAVRKKFPIQPDDSNTVQSLTPAPVLPGEKKPEEPLPSFMETLFPYEWKGMGRIYNPLGAGTRLAATYLGAPLFLGKAQKFESFMDLAKAYEEKIGYEPKTWYEKGLFNYVLPLAADVAADPLTYATLGTGPLAKAMMKAFPGVSKLIHGRSFKELTTPLVKTGKLLEDGSAELQSVVSNLSENYAKILLGQKGIDVIESNIKPLAKKIEQLVIEQRSGAGFHLPWGVKEKVKIGNQIIELEHYRRFVIPGTEGLITPSQWLMGKQGMVATLEMTKKLEPMTDYMNQVISAMSKTNKLRTSINHLDSDMPELGEFFNVFETSATTKRQIQSGLIGKDEFDVAQKLRKVLGLGIDERGTIVVPGIGLMTNTMMLSVANGMKKVSPALTKDKAVDQIFSIFMNKFTGKNTGEIAEIIKLNGEEADNIINDAGKARLKVLREKSVKGALTGERRFGDTPFVKLLELRAKKVADVLPEELPLKQFADSLSDDFVAYWNGTLNMLERNKGIFKDASGLADEGMFKNYLGRAFNLVDRYNETSIINRSPQYLAWDMLNGIRKSLKKNDMPEDELKVVNEEMKKTYHDMAPLLSHSDPIIRGSALQSFFKQLFKNLDVEELPKVNLDEVLKEVQKNLPETLVTKQSLLFPNLFTDSKSQNIVDTALRSAFDKAYQPVWDAITAVRTPKKGGVRIVKEYTTDINSFKDRFYNLVWKDMNFIDNAHVGQFTDLPGGTLTIATLHTADPAGNPVTQIFVPLFNHYTGKTELFTLPKLADAAVATETGSEALLESVLKTIVGGGDAQTKIKEFGEGLENYFQNRFDIKPITETIDNVMGKIFGRNTSLGLALINHGKEAIEAAAKFVNANKIEGRFSAYFEGFIDDAIVGDIETTFKKGFVGKRDEELIFIAAIISGKVSKMTRAEAENIIMKDNWKSLLTIIKEQKGNIPVNMSGLEFGDTSLKLGEVKAVRDSIGKIIEEERLDIDKQLMLLNESKAMSKADIEMLIGERNKLLKSKTIAYDVINNVIMAHDNVKPELLNAIGSINPVAELEKIRATKVNTLKIAIEEGKLFNEAIDQLRIEHAIVNRIIEGLPSGKALSKATLDNLMIAVDKDYIAKTALTNILDVNILNKSFREFVDSVYSKTDVDSILRRMGLTEPIGEKLSKQVLKDSKIVLTQMYEVAHPGSALGISPIIDEFQQRFNYLVRLLPLAKQMEMMKEYMSQFFVETIESMEKRMMMQSERGVQLAMQKMKKPVLEAISLTNAKEVTANTIRKIIGTETPNEFAVSNIDEVKSVLGKIAKSLEKKTDAISKKEYSDLIDAKAKINYYGLLKDKLGRNEILSKEEEKAYKETEKLISKFETFVSKRKPIVEPKPSQEPLHELVKQATGVEEPVVPKVEAKAPEAPSFESEPIELTFKPIESHEELDAMTSFVKQRDKLPLGQEAPPVAAAKAPPKVAELLPKAEVKPPIAEKLKWKDILETPREIPKVPPVEEAKPFLTPPSNELRRYQEAAKFFDSQEVKTWAEKFVMDSRQKILTTSALQDVMMEATRLAENVTPLEKILIDKTVYKDNIVAKWIKPIYEKIVSKHSIYGNYVKTPAALRTIERFQAELDGSRSVSETAGWALAKVISMGTKIEHGQTIARNFGLMQDIISDLPLPPNMSPIDATMGRKMFYYLQNELIDGVEAMTKEEVTKFEPWLDWFKEANRRIWDAEFAAGLLTPGDFLSRRVENYVSRSIANFNKNKGVSKALSQWQIERGSLKKVSVKDPHLMQRVFPDISELKNFIEQFNLGKYSNGVIPKDKLALIDDIAGSMGIRLADASKAILNKRLLERLKIAPGFEDMIKPITTEMSDMYSEGKVITLKNAEGKLTEYHLVGDLIPEFKNYAMDVDLANFLTLVNKSWKNNLTEDRTGIWTAIDVINGIIKRANLFNPFYHAKNILLDVQTSGLATHNPIELVREIKQAYKEIQELDPIYVEAIKNKLMPFSLFSTDWKEPFSVAIAKLVGSKDTYFPPNENLLMTLGKPLLWLKDKSDQILWGQIDAPLRFYLYKQAKKLGLTGAEAASTANFYVIDYAMKSWHPDTKKFGYRMFPFFAWLTGNLWTHMQTLASNPVRYVALVHLVDDTNRMFGGVSIANNPEFFQDYFATPFYTPEGQIYLNPMFPFRDVLHIIKEAVDKGVVQGPKDFFVQRVHPLMRWFFDRKPTTYHNDLMDDRGIIEKTFGNLGDLFNMAAWGYAMPIETWRYISENMIGVDSTEVKAGKKAHPLQMLLWLPGFYPKVKPY